MSEYDHSHSIPFRLVRKAIEAMQKGSGLSVMFQMLVYTGCRMTELDKMRLDMLHGERLFWPLGKRQYNYRNVELPIYFIEELFEHRKTCAIKGNRLFCMSSNTFRRRFNGEIRPTLGQEWNIIRPKYTNKGTLQNEYRYQLRMLRKNYVTLEFAQQLEKWQDSQVAVLFTSKKMRHASTHVTAFAYMENFDTLDIEQHKNCTMAEIISPDRQKRILEY